jgi:hypothetical protein
MDLTIYLEKIVRNFSRYHKYTLGSELRDKSREIVGVIIRANSRVDRLPLLLELRERLEGLKVLIRICKEVKAFSQFNAYVYASTLVVELSRQNEGWIKGQTKGRKGMARIPGWCQGRGGGTPSPQQEGERCDD